MQGTQHSITNSNLIKQLPKSIAFLNKDLEIVFVSEKWTTNFGVSNQNITGKQIQEIISFISEKWLKSLNNSLDGKSTKSEIENYYDENSNQKWLEWTNAPWYDENKNIIGVIVQTENVTHKLFESNKIEKLEILLKGKSEISKIGTWEYDAVKDQMSWCDITKNIYDVSKSYKPSIDSFFNFYKEGYSRNTIAMAMDKAMRHGTAWNEKLQLTTARGKDIWILAAGKPVFKNDKYIGIVGSFQDITNQVQSKSKTEEKERIFKSIFNSSHQFTGILGTDGSILEISDTVLKFTNLKEEDLINKKFWDAYWWPIQDFVREGLKQIIGAAAAGEFMRSEIVVLDNNQKKSYIDFSLRPVYDKNNKVVSLLAEGRFINEMVSARKKLKESEQKFRELYALSPVGYILNEFESGTVLDFNNSFAKTTGYCTKDIGTLNFKHIIKNSTKKTLKRILKELAEKSTFGPLEHVYTKQDGTTYPVLVHGSLVKNGKGEKLIWTMAQDISETKEKEKEIKTERKLLKTLIDNLPLNVYIKDIDSKKILVNKSEVEFSGFENEKNLLGKTDFDLYDEQTAQSYRDEDLRVLNTLNPILGKETLCIKKDGSIATLLISKIPLKGEDGTANSLVGISVDISYLKQKEDELRKLINVTSLQNKKLINFAHIVSHNLRSHTANFSMLLNFLVEEKDETEKTNLIKMLVTASDNLLETIDNLNTVVDINTNINIEKTPVKINDTISLVKKNISALIKAKKATLINEVPDSASVRAIPSYMESIIMNFITNSIKYKHPDRDPIIKITSTKNNGYIVISIKDNGIGIDLKKYGDKLFGMYKTFHKNPDAKGIGLYITKNQVEAMNGKIITCSEVDKGTTFNIYLNEKN
ncbi:MAG: PAS domain S-box protein [Cellulophaga sp.]